MDAKRTGELIAALRKERGMTQRGLAEQLGVTDKAVSRWERGVGCPDVSLLPRLTELLGVDPNGLLSGALEENPMTGGNMKKLQFYLCPQCGNLMTATGQAAVTCCGKRLTPQTPAKAAEGERLTVEEADGMYFITSDHEMTKEHYLTFMALLTGDTLFLRKLYPEWGVEVRIPRIGRGMLVWGCSRHGLFYQLLK